MPTPKQMDRMAAAPEQAPSDDMPPEYWQALLAGARADETYLPGSQPERSLRLDQIPKHLLRVGCRRCGRTVEIQKVDAVGLYGADAVWKDFGRRLLDNTCSQRTGRYEEDGCWPSYD